MERMWTSRLHWRLRGAWMWPAFGALTALDAIVVHAWPIAGRRTDLVAAMLLAAFLNLLAVAVVAPMAGALLRRRRPDLPRMVAHDYAGTVLLVAVAVALAVAGAAHRPAIVDRQQEERAQAVAVHDYVLRSAPPVFRHNLDRADSRRIDAGLYRTCVPGRDPDRPLCLYVTTDRSPPAVRVDPDRETNQSLVGRRPGSPGG